MDIFDDFWLFVRKYLFSILLIFAGLIFLIMGMSSNPTTDGLSQSTNFILGAIVLFLLGFISLYFILNNKFSRTITAIASLIFLAGSAGFILLNVTTVKQTIKTLAEIEKSEDLAKQGLSDIKELQEAYEKKYKKFAPSFDELVRFAKYDSINVLVRAEGDLPNRKMTVPEAKQLGLRYPEVWNEKYALTLGLIIRDYEKVPVAENIFGKKKSKDLREYDFDVDQLNKMRTIDETDKQFTLSTGKVDTITTVLIQALPPYGPQEIYNIKDTFQVGSLTDKNMKSNWK